MANDEDRRLEVSQGRLWFGLATPAAAWVSLGCMDILITWRLCMEPEQFGGSAMHPAVRLLYIAIAAALLVLGVAAGIVSYRNWRALSGGREFLEAKATDRREFMALLGVFVSVTLGMGMLWLAVPPFIIQICTRAK